MSRANKIDIKKYLKNSLVTPELLTSYFVECGGYTGRAKTVTFEQSIYKDKLVYEGMSEDDAYLLPKETAFGNYLKAIKLLSVGRKNRIDLSDPTKREYNQGVINMTIERLVEIANEHILKDKHMIFYDCQDFEKSVRKQYPDMLEISALMPYVIYYVALRQGYDLDTPLKLFTPFKDEDKLKSNLKTGISYNKTYKVSDADMLMSIGTRMHADYKKFLPDARNNPSKI